MCKRKTWGVDIPPEITDGVQIETRSRLYNQAYLEMADMLDGKTPLSIKRAVFLAEWAYHDGNLDYDWFCAMIDSVVTWLNGFIKANGLDKYKTGKNIALNDFFFNPWSGNGYTAFEYNFKDLDDPNDWTAQFVSKVMRTYQGQCRSLPMYYKILAEAIGAEAYIAYAPQHTWIRYEDKDDLFPEDWVNVELTTHQYTPEFWIIEYNEITEKQIESGMYLTPTTDIQTVAGQLSDLAHGYWKKYEVYDDFTWLCTDKSLKYHPARDVSWVIRGNTLQQALLNHVSHTNGLMDNYAVYLESLINDCADQLDAIGWKELDEEFFKRRDQRDEETRRIIEETGGGIILD